MGTDRASSARTLSILHILRAQAKHPLRLMMGVDDQHRTINSIIIHQEPI
jgi:hypothetical protein